MTNISECELNPCENGGNCTDTMDSFLCDCVPGFTGKTCITNIDECDPNPCENGGNCTDMMNEYICDCIPGFAGETCIELGNNIAVAAIV